MQEDATEPDRGAVHKDEFARHRHRPALLQRLMHLEGLAAPILRRADILGDAALSQVANTVIGLPATSGAATSEALARRADLIAKKIDIASLRDPAKLDAFVRRFAAIWDAQNNTASAPVLALFTGTGTLDAETLQSLQTARIGA